MDDYIPISKAFLEFKSDVRDSANQIVQHLPQKIYNTAEIWKELSMQAERATNEVIQKDGWEAKAVPCNATLVTVLQRLKSEVESVLEMLKTLKLHFSLSTTEMRLSASFSAEVERELLQELKMATAAARLILKALSQYPALRAAVLTKAMKTPNFEDSRRAIAEHDFLQGLNIHKWLHDLQHLHTLLDDLINKNYKSLKSLQTPFRHKNNRTVTTSAARSVHSRTRTFSCEDAKGDDVIFSLFG
jgi:hypothetical protein